jgi:hypothetical protein
VASKAHLLIVDDDPNALLRLKGGGAEALPFLGQE